MERSLGVCGTLSATRAYVEYFPLHCSNQKEQNMAFNGLSGEEVKSKGLGRHSDKAPVTLPMSQCTSEANSFFAFSILSD